MVVFGPVALKRHLWSLDGSLKSSAAEGAFKTIWWILDSIIAAVVYLFTSSGVPVCFHGSLICFSAVRTLSERDKTVRRGEDAVISPLCTLKNRTLKS